MNNALLRKDRQGYRLLSSYLRAIIFYSITYD